MSAPFLQCMSAPFLQCMSAPFLQCMSAPFLQCMTASMRDIIDEDTAYHCSSRMLCDVIRVFNPDEIPSVAGEVAFMLCYWTQHAIQRLFNSLELEISLEIIKHCHGSYEDHHQNTAAHEEGEDDDDDDDDNVDVEEEEEEEEEEKEVDDDDDDDIQEEEEEEEEEENAVVAWATTESMNNGGAVSHGLFGSSSTDEVEAFLRSWRAQTWESKTQCMICFECLGTVRPHLEDDDMG